MGSFSAARRPCGARTPRTTPCAPSAPSISPHRKRHSIIRQAADISRRGARARAVCVQDMTTERLGGDGKKLETRGRVAENTPAVLALQDGRQRVESVCIGQRAVAGRAHGGQQLTRLTHRFDVDSAIRPARRCVLARALRRLLHHATEASATRSVRPLHCTKNHLPSWTKFGATHADHVPGAVGGRCRGGRCMAGGAAPSHCHGRLACHHGGRGAAHDASAAATRAASPERAGPPRYPPRPPVHTHVAPGASA